MNSTLKTGLFLFVLVGVIFAVTIIATYTPPAPPPNGGGGTGEGEPLSGAALNFASTKMAYSPDSEDISSRFFPGVFEISDVHQPVSFWFQNPHTVPVKVNALGRSCTSCSAARVMVFPHEGMKDFQLRAVAASLPIGPTSPPALLLPLALAGLCRTTQWNDLDFDHPDQGAEVMPRSPDGMPTWGLFQVGIQVKGHGIQPKDVTIGLTPGKAVQQKLRFDILLAGVPPFTLYPPSLNFGELPEGASSQTVTIHYWTGTREQQDLPPPILGGFDSADPFLQVGAPVAMSAAERTAFAQALVAGGKSLRVTAGYKFTVTLHRRRTDLPSGPTEPDIGPFSRDIDVTGKNLGVSAKLPIIALVTGLVGLTDGLTKIDLKGFESKTGIDKRLTLASDRADLTLEPAVERMNPPYLKVALEAAPKQAQRRFWTMTVTVPPDACVGDLPTDSFVVLRAKTADGPRLVRIPVIGRGRTSR